jgi:hypothetical protein
VDRLGGGSHGAARELSRLNPRHGFWLAAKSFAVAMATANLPVPLYPLLEKRDGFRPAMVAVIFAAYAGGVIAILMLLGRLSDCLGRRAVLIPALSRSATGTTIFVACHGAVALIAGHAHRPSNRPHQRRDDRIPRRPSRGFPPHRAASARRGRVHRGEPSRPRRGPLVAGLLATHTRHPLVVPFALFAALALLAAVTIAAAPETVTPAPTVWACARFPGVASTPGA